MKQEILELEKNLLKYEYISNKDFLEKTIHDNFLECGKSGMLFNKEVTVNELLSCKEDRNIKIYNFTCEQIDANTYLIHYITISNDKEYYRTSIWTKENNLKLLYHQATEYNEDTILIEN
jgi:hypothetical protein